jgi:solute carrier family 25 folate transporter 32
MPDPHLVAGVLSGLLTSGLLHPLDVLKTRYQVQDGLVNALRYRSLAGAVRDVLGSEGVRGFYRGMAPALLGSGASWGLYFYFYEACKRRLRAGGGGAPLSPAQHAYAAWEGGTVTCLFTNPVWLVKTRMQLQTGSGSGGGGGGYTSMAHAFASIVRQEGPQGLYRGLAPALLLTLHGVVQFVTYEALKERLSAGSGGSGGGGGDAGALLGAGVLSKVAAVTLTYPYQVTKARLQQRTAEGAAPAYSGLVNCMLVTGRREGLRGFYRGFLANLLRVAPQSALTLLLYERIRGAVERWQA